MGMPIQQFQVQWTFESVRSVDTKYGKEWDGERRTEFLLLSRYDRLVPFDVGCFLVVG